MGPAAKRILRIGGYAANIAAGAATLCAAYGGMVDPMVSTIPAIFAMSFPFWVGVAVVLAIVDLLAKCRKMALIPAAALILCAGPLMSYAPVNLMKKSVDSRDSSKVFTLVSFNVANLIGTRTHQEAAELYTAPGAPSNEIVDYIIGCGADLVITQEFPPLTPSRYLGFTEAQIDTLLTLYPHSLVPAFSKETQNEHRCKIFSKFPLRRVAIPGCSGFSEWSAAMVDIRGTETLVIDVHLQSIGLTPKDRELYVELTEGEGRGKMGEVRHTLLSKLSKAMRLRADQARALRHAIDSIGAPNVIVSGDFNDIPGCYAMREIAGDDFRNAFNDAANGPMITFHSDRFYFHIDHILYRGAMEAVDLRRGDCSASDHYPVRAAFLLE